jgi:hypothetical protein
MSRHRDTRRARDLSATPEMLLLTIATAVRSATLTEPPYAANPCTFHTYKGNNILD